MKGVKLGVKPRLRTGEIEMGNEQGKVPGVVVALFAIVGATICLAQCQGSKEKCEASGGTFKGIEKCIPATPSPVEQEKKGND